MVIIIVMVVLYKPVKRTLVTRNEYVEKQILEAKENNTLSEQNRNQIAEANKAQMIEDTNEQIRKMKLNAEEEIQKAKQEAIDEVHNEIVNVALDASKELLQREINEKDSKKFVEDFLKDVK